MGVMMKLRRAYGSRYTDKDPDKEGVGRGHYEIRNQSCDKVVTCPAMHGETGLLSDP